MAHPADIGGDRHTFNQNKKNDKGYSVDVSREVSITTRNVPNCVKRIV